MVLATSHHAFPLCPAKANSRGALQQRCYLQAEQERFLKYTPCAPRSNWTQRGEQPISVNAHRKGGDLRVTRLRKPDRFLQPASDWCVGGRRSLTVLWKNWHWHLGSLKTAGIHSGWKTEETVYRGGENRGGTSDGVAGEQERGVGRKGETGGSKPRDGVWHLTIVYITVSYTCGVCAIL